MTDAGRAVFPYLLETEFTIDDIIVEELRKHPVAMDNFSRFPELYKRVKIGNIQMKRNNSDLYRRRLDNNMILTFVVVFIVVIVSGRGINPLALLCLPVVMVVEYVLCLGIALIVSSLTVYLRDLQYILGIFVMALQYMTPVMYGVDMVENSGAGDWLILIFNLNPMTPIIKIYRQIIYYGEVPELGSLALALIIGIVFIVVGEVLFKKLQRGFAEEF